MAKFITCDIPFIGNYEKIDQPPINISLCCSLDKGGLWADNKEIAYEIIFIMVNNHSFTWKFNTQEDRDNEYNRILSNNS